MNNNIDNSSVIVIVAHAISITKNNIIAANIYRFCSDTGKVTAFEIVCQVCQTGYAVISSMCTYIIVAVAIGI